MWNYVSFLLFYAVFVLISSAVGKNPTTKIQYDQQNSRLTTVSLQCDMGFCPSKNLSSPVSGKPSFDYEWRTVHENVIPWENLTKESAFDMEELLPVSTLPPKKLVKSKRDNTAPSAETPTKTAKSTNASIAKAQTPDEIEEGSGALESEIFTTTSGPSEIPTSNATTSPETSTITPPGTISPAVVQVRKELIRAPQSVTSTEIPTTTQATPTTELQTAAPPAPGKTVPTTDRTSAEKPFFPTEIIHEPVKIIMPAISQPAQPEDRTALQPNKNQTMKTDVSSPKRVQPDREADQNQFYQPKCPPGNRQIHIQHTRDDLSSEQCAEFVELPVTDPDPHSVTFDIPFPHDPILLALCGDPKMTDGKGFSLQYWDCDSPAAQLPGDDRARETPVFISTDHRVLQLKSFFTGREIFITAIVENGRSILYEIFLEKEIRAVRRQDVPLRHVTSLAVVQKTYEHVYIGFSINNPNRKDRTSMHEKISPLFRMHHGTLHLCGYASILHSTFVAGWTDVMGDVVFAFVANSDKRTDKSTLVFYRVVEDDDGSCRVIPKPGQAPIQSVDNAPLCGVRFLAPYYRHPEIHLIVSVDSAPGTSNCPSDSVEKSFLLRAGGHEKGGVFQATGAVYFPGPGRFARSQLLEGWCTENILMYGTAVKAQLFSIGKDLEIAAMNYQGVPRNFANLAMTYCGDHILAKFCGSYFEPRAMYSIFCDPESCENL